MSDKRSISEIMKQTAENHRATLEKLSSDSDGKDDFTEGKSYFDRLQKIDLPKGTIEGFEKVFQKHRSFWDRVTLFLKAENQAGRWAKVIKDFALIFVPYGKQISTVTEFINQRLLPQSKDNTMLDIIKRVFTTANGGFWRLWDELEGRDLKYYIAFAVRVLIILGIYYGADYLGIPVSEVIATIFGTG